MRIFLLLMGCVSFPAVEATAQLGHQVGEFRRALDPLPTWCLLSVASGTQDPKECEKLEADAKIFRKIPIQLAAWSEALQAMAADKGGRGLGADVGALAAVGYKDKSIGAAAEALASLITSSYRRSALRASLKDAAPHVAQLVKYARDNVALQRERLDALDEETAKIALGLPLETPSQVAERVALVDVSAWLRECKSTLADYDRALAAFGAAHDKLARGNASDPELYFAILEDLKKLSQGAIP
jgi:hypothetical protein